MRSAASRSLAALAIVRVPARVALLASLVSLLACPMFGGSDGPTGPTSQYPYDGNYSGRWSAVCPKCNIPDAAGTFTMTIANGAFTGNTGFPIDSGNFGSPKRTSGTVSSGGAISATGTTPRVCSSSVDTFTAQVVTNSSGGATMTMSYSRPSSVNCTAETGTVTATRTP